MRRITSLLLAFLFCLLTTLPAFALETTTVADNSSATEFKEEPLLNENPVVITEASTELYSEPVSSESENSLEASEQSENSLNESEYFTYPEVTTTVASEETTVHVDNTGKPYTTIYFSGLSLNYTLKLKNVETKEVYEIQLNKANKWIVDFDGPEGEYKLSFETKSVAGKAGKIYNKNNEVVKTVKIKRTDGWQLIELKVTEKITFALGKILKEHWLLLILIILLGGTYVYLRTHRVLPSEER